MIHKMNRTTFLTAIFLSLATVAIFSVCLLPSIEALSSFRIEQIESDYVTGLSDSKSIALPKIITIQGAVPPAGTSGDTIQPRVVNFNPPNGATGVPLSPVTIAATFSEPVQVSTVTTSTFQVRDSAGSIVPGRVTISAPNLNAVFTPSSQLASSKLYSVTITTGVKDLAGNPLVGITKSTFTTATQTPVGDPAAGTTTTEDTTPPKVVSVNPRNGATGIQFSSPITATFSEPVQPSTVNPTTFYIEALPSHSRTPGTVMLGSDGKTFRFQPAGQIPSPWFIVVITPEVRDLKGNGMTAPVVWAFSTVAAPPAAGATTPPPGTAADTIQPRVVSFNPANGATGVPISSSISAKFSEPVQASTVSTSTFQVRDSANNVVPGTITMEPAGVPPMVIMFKSSSPLASSKLYSVIITTGVKDLAGNPLVGITKSTFTTAAITAAGATTPPPGTAADTIQPRVVSFNPANGATGVPISSPITATFSEPVHVSTVSTSTFQVRDSTGTIVPGTVTLLTAGPNVNTAMFRPSAPLGTSKLYSVTITTGVKDLAGNPLVGTTKWSFTTITQTPAGTSGDTTPLKVVSIKPANGATGIAVSSSIIVTFSEPVQPSTVTTSTFKLSTTDTGGGIGPLQIPSIVNVPGTVTLSTDGKTGTFRPTQPLTVAKYHYYTLTGVKDLTGNSLTPFPNLEGSFTTGSP